VNSFSITLPDDWLEYAPGQFGPNKGAVFNAKGKWAGIYIAVAPTGAASLAETSAVMLRQFSNAPDTQICLFRSVTLPAAEAQQFKVRSTIAAPSHDDQTVYLLSRGDQTFVIGFVELDGSYPGSLDDLFDQIIRTLQLLD
jgi:hypothetical protein